MSSFFQVIYTRLQKWMEESRHEREQKDKKKGIQRTNNWIPLSLHFQSLSSVLLL